MINQELFLIVAMASNGVIGANGALPWHIPADLRRFKTLTMGLPMIMGRKTFDSLPGLLPGRRHIVVTRDPDWQADGAETASSLDHALTLANGPKVAVIGGAEVFALALPLAHRIELTEVHADIAGDTLMPPLGEGWREAFRERHPAEGARPAFAFVTLKRRMMRLDHREAIPENLRGAILALGNFDGFHQGHQAVVGEAVDWARAEGRPAIVATFDPHPMRHFVPDAPPFRLTTLDQREELFAAAGADAMLVFHFDAAMAAMEAGSWAGGMISRHLGAAGIVTGEDFTFGKGRGGNPDLLRERGVRTRTVAAVHDEEGSISSSRIRAALKAGDCGTATRLMTRPFAIRGPVLHGDKRGRTIGYTTANLELGTYLRPRYGIYAVTAALPGGKTVLGAANLGIRPSFDPPKELLEPHFFDFAGDLYGQEIEVRLHHFLRPEAKFDALEALTAQMERDCEEARKVLSAPAS